MDFERYVETFQSLYLNAKNTIVPALPPLKTLLPFTPKKILILAPHPDDECLMGGVALRAQEEFDAEVWVLPFSYGSKKERRAERKIELMNALKILDFKFLDPRMNGADDELTEGELLNAILATKADSVITTHRRDGHPAHIRSAEMAKRALHAVVKKTNQKFALLQTEFWQSMETPNLLIPLSARQLSTLGRALMEHQGEVVRNPYHLTLPAWAMDQVRRGSEMQNTSMGKPAVDAVFGQILNFEWIQTN